MDNNVNTTFENNQNTTETQSAPEVQSTFTPQYEPTTQYQPQPQVPVYQPELEEPVSLGDWVGTLLLINFVPCIGLIMCIVWAFSKDTKKSKANFCKAYLIIYLISIVLVVALYALLFGLMFATGSF